ncbi:MAG: glycosyltransferase family 2 protein [Sphingobacteriaceae bacterium]|nr:MAG: glycosyltransferase family 2 protein [Sphingobacteriaceae bacterium]
MVSVCIASFNGEKYIKEQILSILNQIDSNDEIIISDDASTDKTLSIIEGIEDLRIKILSGKVFRDPIKNFQNALLHAKGNFIFLSDQDDVWREGKYKEMLQLLYNYDLIVSDSVIVNEQLQTIHPSFFKYFNSGKGIVKNIIKSSYYGSCMAFKKQVLSVALPFPDTKEIGHDLWIGLVAEITGKVYFYPKPLLLYRRHHAAFTPVNVGRSSRTKYQMLRGRIIMIKEVFKFYIKYKLNWKKD